MFNTRHIAVAAACGLVTVSPLMTSPVTAQDMMVVGYNQHGQLGFDSDSNMTLAVNIGGLPGEIVEVAGSHYHTLALLADGTVWAWGDNTWGELGNGTNISSSTPQSVPNVTDIIAIAAGTDHSLALRSDGTVLAWGGCGWGQCGVGISGTHLTSPAQVHWLTNIVAISAGEYFSMALRSDGTVWTWGKNVYGQLGNGTTTNATTAVMVSGINNAIQIAAGGDHAMALRANKTIMAWGRNNFGQLGNNSTTDSTLPVSTVYFGTVAELAAGSNHSLARGEDGLVYAWGANTVGQVGDGTTTNRQSPVAVQRISDASRIFAKSSFSGAIRDEVVFTWGHNFSGQLGDGSTVNRATPAPVARIPHAINAYAGRFHLIVLVPSQSPTCPADLNGDNAVNVSDLLLLFSAWGMCP